MATDIATLGIKIEASDIRTAVRELDKLEKQTKDNEKSTKDLTGSFGGLKSAVAAVAGSMVVRHFFQTAASFETMAVSLETVTGSAERAQEVMSGLAEFASTTPFSIRDLTDAFIKLKALGIQPTESNLRSFGNTSSAMGKSLNQMIEAVADAATGEFERLKEFGIKAKSQGDQVSFTFQGVTKTVGKNSAEITKYLEDIGNLQFAGAMSKQMDTLNGKISNLGDTFDQLILTVANLGAGDGGSGILDLAITSVKTFTKVIETSDVAISDYVNGIVYLKNAIGELFTLDFDGLKKLGVERQKQSDEAKARIDAIWAEKSATEQLNATKRIGGSIDTATSGAKDAGIFPEEESIAAGYEKLRQSLLTKEEMIKESEERNQFTLETAYQQGLITYKQYEDLKTRASKQQEKLRKKAAFSAVRGALSDIASLTNSKNEKLFKLGKAAAISQALINTYLGVTKTMTAVPYPFNIPLAAAQGAAGLVQVQNIRAQKFQGQAHSGLDNVPNEGTYLLQKGEMVLDAGTSEQVRNNALGAGGSLNFTINTVDAEGVDRLVMNHGEKFYAAVQNQMYENNQSFA